MKTSFYNRSRNIHRLYTILPVLDVSAHYAEQVTCSKVFTLREIYDKLQVVKELQVVNTPKGNPLSERAVAEQDEQARFNTACLRSGPALLQTPSGIRLVWRVSSDWWYDCGPDHATASSIPGQNDQTWAALLQQVGEPRHPFFTKLPASRNGRRRR